MKTLEQEEADKLFDKYWFEMTSEWFKVEVLQDYTGEDDGPSLQSWLKGDRHTSIELMDKEVSLEWIESCKDKLKNGVKLTRFHIVQEPYTPYLEWELEHYKRINIGKCGEQVFLVKKSEIQNSNIPAGDFMIFDNKRAVVNAYNPSGKVISQTFYDENDDITSLLSLKENLRKIAEPL